MTGFTPIDSANFFTRIQIGSTAENKWLEFKTAYSKEDPLELARDIAQFANTEGGTLLFGVSEEKDSTGKLNVAKEFVGVSDVDRLKQAIEQAIQNHITPSTFRPVSETIKCQDSKVVVALNVPPSRHVIYVCKREDQGHEKSQKHLIECLHRTNHGKDWMNPDELERHLMNGSRAAKLDFGKRKRKRRRSIPKIHRT